MKPPNCNLLYHQHDNPEKFAAPSMTDEIESNDSTFETNEDLLLWNMGGAREDERWGLWS
jgi:hypothetical protein